MYWNRNLLFRFQEESTCSGGYSASWMRYCAGSVVTLARRSSKALLRFTNALTYFRDYHRRLGLRKNYKCKKAGVPILFDVPSENPARHALRRAGRALPPARQKAAAAKR